jgi:hypothetical protein
MLLLLLQNFVDWDYRKNVHKKASADYIGGKAFGKSITVVEAGTYEELVASTSEDVLFDLYARPIPTHARIPQTRHSTPFATDST